MAKIPLISVIIPVYNDPGGLTDTLSSIINQQFDKYDYEILVVDNASKDKTLAVANEFREKFPGLIKILIEDKIQGSYSARNMGINSSTGEIIAFIDTDMTVEPDWLSKIKDIMSDKEISYAGCNVEMVLKKKSIAGLYNKIIGFKVDERIKSDHYAPTCCLVIKREVTDKTGLFDYRLVSGGDREFGCRVWQAGYRQFFAENVKMFHPARDTIKQLLKKYFRTGRGKFQLTYYHNDIYPHSESSSIKYIFIRPISFAKSMRKKIKKYKLNWFYIILFYYIKWIKRVADFTGYHYEKNQLRHLKRGLA